MKGLLLKDSYVLWKNSKFSLIISLIFLILSMASGMTEEISSNYLATFPFLFMGVLPMTLLAYDENYRWDSYAAAMPYTKAQIVSAKYIFALILNLSIFCLLLAATAIKAYVFKVPSTDDLLLYSGLFLSFGFLLPSIMLPIIFKFGVQKSRLIYMFLYIAVFSMFSIVKKVDSVPVLPRITLGLPSIIALVCAALFGLYALSWALSVKFYKRREF